MEFLDLTKHRKYLIFGLVAIFSLFALWIRLIPLFTMGKTDVLMMVASDDPLYNLRQVEQIIANFPNYAWFDPMSLYPTGSTIYWGPLFPTIIAACCLLTGASTRPEIISLGLIIPPIMAAAIVAIMYYIGKCCGDWKTGILASGFTAIVTGQFYYRSLYGYMDHHIAEVLFSTIFCLFYMYAILSEKESTIDLKNFHTYKKTIIFSCLAGIAYILGLLVMPTMILFALIVGAFTVLQFIIDHLRGRTSEYLLIINSTIFIIAIAGLLLFGFKTTGLDLSLYSIGHVYAYIGLIAGTAFLFLLAGFLKTKERYFFPAAVIACAVIFALILYIFNPQMYSLLVNNLFAFFGQAPVTDTVQEARGWTTALAWTTFNFGLFLMLGGIIVMVYNNFRDEHPTQVFVLVWSLIMLFSTWQHVRYEYYLAINVALLSAACISFVIARGGDEVLRMEKGLPGEGAVSERKEVEKEGHARSKKQKNLQKKGTGSRPANYPAICLFIVGILVSILFIYASVSLSYLSATQDPMQMNPDWRESLDWMANNTPETGVNYLTIYDPKTFQYPSHSYGVMSWWDYGHLITYIAKRIPNANPFQQGVAGADGSAAFFISTSEGTANSILDHVGTRYIVTDAEMDTGKFWAMATWYNSTDGSSPYQITLLTPGRDDPNNYDSFMLNEKPYYHTMISRLHNFDGSMTTPASVYYVEYADPGLTGASLPLMTKAEVTNSTDAAFRAEQFNKKAQAGYHAQALNPSLVSPVDKIPALSHYRLVHESPTNVLNSKTVDLKYVKVFEYVKGAHIKGEGIIEVPVVTNTGRNYTYRQESVNGEFVVPYSTTGNPYGVKTTGKYQIVGTGRQYDVPEAAVMQGLTIQ
ncbi:oligosaccharyl transferase, archaeosortase A system-associated [uncultured Methanoregula sp.]|uniref:oligosaccharyl transferase, archaeosortase A system-associated n=1 Tax=uncultured Methanoregula sp. TaxID=1005933 RepID=UPI002AAB14F3|nr:oligosaccharyl transferase, archaeosortase A system-associated [uncultured Methanoregula sp.]